MAARSPALSTSPIKRSAARAELCEPYGHRPGKMVRLGKAGDVRAGRGYAEGADLGSARRSPSGAAAAGFSFSSTTQVFSPPPPGNHGASSRANAAGPSIMPYRRTLQTSTGSRIQFRAVTSSSSAYDGSDAKQMAMTPAGSPTRLSSQGTPPRLPKTQAGSGLFAGAGPTDPTSPPFSAPTSSAAIDVSSLSMPPRGGQKTLPSNATTFRFGEQASLLDVSERTNLACGRRAIHGGKGTMSFGGGLPTTSAQNSTFRPQPHLLQQDARPCQQRPRHEQSVAPSNLRTSSSGVSPALKALQFSPALRPSSPPSLNLPTLRQLDDNAMLDDEEFDGPVHNDSALEHNQPGDWTRRTPDSDMWTPRASPGTNTSHSTEFVLNQSVHQRQRAQPKAHGLLHQTLLKQHQTSMTLAGKSRPSGGAHFSEAGGLTRSASFDYGSSEHSRTLRPAIRWSFRDSQNLGNRSESPFSMSSSLSDEPSGKMHFNGGSSNGLYGGGGTLRSMSGGRPSPSPLLSGSSMELIYGTSRSTPANLRPNTPVGDLSLAKQASSTNGHSWISLSGIGSDNMNSSLLFSPVLSVAFGNTPAPSETSSLNDEDFEL